MAKGLRGRSHPPSSLVSLYTAACTLSAAFTVPGLHRPMPLLTESLLRPLISAAMLSPACASSKVLWNISRPVTTPLKRLVYPTNSTSAPAYYFNLAANMPDIWGYPEDMVLDVPEQYRSIYQYRTTLGHKANHLFEGKNTEYDTVNHPVHGGIVILVASHPIQPDDEVIVDYLYEVEDAEPWYQDLYYRTYNETSEED